MSEPLRLNLGAAERAFPGYLSVDIAPPADVIADLNNDWPWDTGSVASVLAYDIFEHLADRIFTMNELHRVLIPGGRATIELPNAARGVGQWQDPTHVSPFCLSTFKYFEYGSFAHGRLAKSYGITAAFRILELSERESNGEDLRERVWKILAVLEAMK